MLLKVTLLALLGTALADYHQDYYPSEHDGYSHGHEHKYHGPPAPLKHDGTVDYTPEVKHARAAHFAALEAYKSSFPGHGHQGPYYNHGYHAVPFAHFYNHNPAPVKYDGSVDDLPEVKAARAAHLAEYSKALYRHKRSYSLGAPLKHDGTVDETPEVKHAKAEHFAALAHARSFAPHHQSHEPYSHGGYNKYFEPAPLNHDGTVADTDDVKHAKAILFKAHSEAKSRLHFSPHYPSHHEQYEHHDHHAYPKKYYGPPAPLNHDGTVAETPEVKKAKAVHFKLYSQALHRYRRSAPLFQPAPLNPDGTVAETPEVQHAKAAFLAAHAAESAHADHSWVEPQYNDEPKYNNYVQPKYNNYVQPKYDNYVQPIQYSFPIKPIYEEPQHHAPAHHFAPAQHYSKHFEPAPLNHDGTVADTPAIKAAKAIHFAAYHNTPVSFPQTYHQHQPYSAPAHSHGYSHAPAPSHGYSHAPAHFSNHKHVIPAPLNHDGTVAETPEIIAAKAIHFAAHQEAHARAVPNKFAHQYY